MLRVNARALFVCTLSAIIAKKFKEKNMIPFSDEELLKPVTASLQKVLPMLENDGGGMELLGIKNGKIYVRLTGHCHGCAASTTTLKYGIERQLRIDIHPELEVINVPMGEEFDIDRL